MRAEKRFDSVFSHSQKNLHFVLFPDRIKSSSSKVVADGKMSLGSAKIQEILENFQKLFMHILTKYVKCVKVVYKHSTSYLSCTNLSCLFLTRFDKILHFILQFLINIY